MMYKPFILLLGMFLGSLVPIAAQTPVPRIVLAQAHFAPIITILPPVLTPLPAVSFRLSQDPEKSNANFSLRFAAAYPRDYRREHFSPMDEVETLILTQSSLPLVQFWGGRLQLAAFQSTLHIQTGQLGPAGNGGMRGSRLAGQSYPDGLRSIHLSGLSLSFRFGRDARSGHPAQLWRRLTQMVGAVLD
jgi:hypothetical protein